MDGGWIKIHRKLIDWEWWGDIHTTYFFLFCLLNANIVNKRWRGVDVERGSFVSSLEEMSQKTGMTVQQIRTAIRKLKSTGEITSRATNKNTVITICNYCKYQLDKVANQQAKQQANQQTNNKQTTNKQQTKQNFDGSDIIFNINNKYREEEEEEEEEEKKEYKEKPKESDSLCSLLSVPEGTSVTDSIARIIPPPLAYVKEYCRQRGNGIDAEEFYNFYDSKGWMIGKSKMKKWTSAIVTWEKSRKNRNTENGRRQNEADRNNGVSEEFRRRILAELGGGE